MKELIKFGKTAQCALVAAWFLILMGGFMAACLTK